MLFLNENWNYSQERIEKMNLQIHPDALVTNQANKAGKTPEESKILKAKDFKLPVLTHYREGAWNEEFFFVQIAEPMFGKLAQPEDSCEEEKRLAKKLIQAVNKMTPRPRFLVVCGDFTHAKNGEKIHFLQTEAFKVTFNELVGDIHVICVCGGNEMGDNPSADIMEAYKRNFGDDWFSFWVEGIQFVVINSLYYKFEDQVNDLKAEQQEWLESLLFQAQINPPQQIIMLQSLPWFCSCVEEPDSTRNIDTSTRNSLLSKIKEGSVNAIFAAGERNGGGKDGHLEMILTSPLTSETGNFRVIKVTKDKVLHKSFSLDQPPLDLISLF